jgi:hypothetical protein
VSVQYQVVKEAVYDAFYKLTDSKTQITSYGESQAWWMLDEGPHALLGLPLTVMTVD